jgi:hypothetical protein
MPLPPYVPTRVGARGYSATENRSIMWRSRRRDHMKGGCRLKKIPKRLGKREERRVSKESATMRGGEQRDMHEDPPSSKAPFCWWSQRQTSSEMHGMIQHPDILENALLLFSLPRKIIYPLSPASPSIFSLLPR